MSYRKSLDRNELIEDLMDLKIKLAMASYAEMDGKALLEENRNLKRTECYSLNRETKAKLVRRLNRYYYRQKGREILQICRRGGSKVAVALFIIMASLWTSMFTVEAVRTKVLNLMLDVQEKFTQIQLKENAISNNDENELKTHWADTYAPQYIPEGYTISEFTSNKNLKTIQYSNADNSTIIFQQYSEESSINIDTENADSISKVTIQGTEGMLGVKGDVVTVTWSKDHDIFLLYVYQSELSNEEVLKIAESVELTD